MMSLRTAYPRAILLTGPVAKGEIDGRSALGPNLYFVPAGVNEQAISAAGLTMLVCQDRAEAVAEIAGCWHSSRYRRAAILRFEDGEN
jgi:hypothetical protein